MRILLVKMSSLGDLIHAFPVLQYLKQNYPEAEIDWVVERPFAEIVGAHPHVSNVLTVETKKWRRSLFSKSTWKDILDFRKELRKKRYDIVLDLQGNIKSALITSWAKSPLKVGFGYKTVSEWPNVLTTHKKFNPPSGKNIREDYLFIAQSAFGNFTGVKKDGVKLTLHQDEQEKLNSLLEKVDPIAGLKVMVCPGSNWQNKQLSYDTLRSFLQFMSAHWKVHFLFVWGNSTEHELVEKLSNFLPNTSTIVDKISLPTLQNLMAAVDLVIAMDSLPLHLAGTTSTPTYSIFGPSSAFKYQPSGESHGAFQGSCPYGKKFVKRCTRLRTCKTGACMKFLQGEQLFFHFEEWWKEMNWKKVT